VKLSRTAAPAPLTIEDAVPPPPRAAPFAAL
jgi:hypothetical protein